MPVPATAADLPALRHIELAAARLFPPGALPAAELDKTVPAETLREGMELGRLLICRDRRGLPVAFALWQEHDGAALLAEMDVLPCFSRQGAGTCLAQRVIMETARSGFPVLWLTTFAHIPWNAPFYRRQGFAVIPHAAQPDFIRQILADERNRGLQNRVAMSLCTANSVSVNLSGP